MLFRKSEPVKNAIKTGKMLITDKVPSNIHKAKGVKSIEFIGTKLVEFPPAKMLKHKDTLERLTISTSYPIEFDSSKMNEFKKLKTFVLWARGSELNPLPNLPELEKLEVVGTSIYTARPDLSNFSVYKKLKKLSLVSIDLDPIRMCYFPTSVTTLKDLEYLDLNSNSVTKIPPEIKKLTNLKYLNLSGNSYKPTEFPTPVCELHNLEELKTFLINSIPSDIIKMKKLRALTVEIEKDKPINIHSNILKMSGLKIHVKEKIGVVRARANSGDLRLNFRWIDPMSVNDFYERYGKKEKVYKFKMNKNTSFVGSNILNSSMKNMSPNKRYFIVPPNTRSNLFLVKRVINKNALNKCEGKCPFTRVRFTSNNIRHLNKNVILNYFKNRLNNSTNINRDVENFKKNKPSNITNKEINDIVKNIKRHQLLKKVLNKMKNNPSNMSYVNNLKSKGLINNNDIIALKRKLKFIDNSHKSPPMTIKVRKGMNSNNVRKSPYI